MDKLEQVVNAMYKTFDTDNDGKVGKTISKFIFEYTPLLLLSPFSTDFKEFVIGFLLTTKGTMEEKLDYTFQLYGMLIHSRNGKHSHSSSLRY